MDKWKEFCRQVEQWLNRYGEDRSKIFYVIRYKGKVIWVNAFQKIYYRHKDILDVVKGDIAFCFAYRFAPDNSYLNLINKDTPADEKIKKLTDFAQSLMDKGLITIEIYE